MTCQVEYYKSNSERNYSADIYVAKYSNLYTMAIYEPIEKGSDLVNVIYKNDYWAIQNARRALYRQGKNMNVKFTRVKGKLSNVETVSAFVPADGIRHCFTWMEYNGIA